MNYENMTLTSAWVTTSNDISSGSSLVISWSTIAMLNQQPRKLKEIWGSLGVVLTATIFGVAEHRNLGRNRVWIEELWNQKQELIQLTFVRRSMIARSTAHDVTWTCNVSNTAVLESSRSEIGTRKGNYINLWKVDVKHQERQRCQRTLQPQEWCQPSSILHI